MSEGWAAHQIGADLDGRAERSARTSQLVVESFLDLLVEGEPHPTARQVSERSGVSMRSIFRLFDDVEALHAAAITAQLYRVQHLIVDLDATGSLERRVKALVDSRAKLFEAISPVRRMAVRLAPKSRPIRADLALANDFFRTQVIELFADEFAARTVSHRRDTVDAVDATASWETWDRLRRVQGVSEHRARRIMLALVRGALLGVATA